MSRAIGHLTSGSWTQDYRPVWALPPRALAWKLPPVEAWRPHRHLLGHTPALLVVQRLKHTSHTFVWFSSSVWKERASQGTGSFFDARHFTGQARNDLDEVLALKNCAAKYEDWKYTDAYNAKIKQDLSTEQSSQQPVVNERKDHLCWGNRLRFRGGRIGAGFEFRDKAGREMICQAEAWAGGTRGGYLRKSWAPSFL